MIMSCTLATKHRHLPQSLTTSLQFINFGSGAARDGQPNSTHRLWASGPGRARPRRAVSRPAGCRRGWCPGSPVMTPSCHAVATPSHAPTGVPPASRRPLSQAPWEMRVKRRSGVSALETSVVQVLLQVHLRHLQLLWGEHNNSDMLHWGLWPSVTFGGFVIIPPPPRSEQDCVSTNSRQATQMSLFWRLKKVLVNVKEASTMNHTSLVK